MAICEGYFHNAAKLRGIGEYVNLRTSVSCYLHPTSALYGSGQTAEYVVYHEVLLTAKEYMRIVTSVEAHWLTEAGPMFFTIRQAGEGKGTQAENVIREKEEALSCENSTII